MLGDPFSWSRSAPIAACGLMPLLKAYQQQYLGAMFSGCGGVYLIVVVQE
jgi:hypothetical protein